MKKIRWLLIGFVVAPLSGLALVKAPSLEFCPSSPCLQTSSLIVLAVRHQASKRKRYRSTGFPQKRAATGRRVFIFSPRMLMWAVYDANGNLVRTGRASGGKGYCPDIRRSCRTPRGVFSLRSKGPRHCRSTRYPVPRGGAPMPYCAFFLKYYAIHGSPDVPGYNASHGCIRVQPAAAAWLSGYLQIGSTVIVTSY